MRENLLPSVDPDLDPYLSMSLVELIDANVPEEKFLEYAVNFTLFEIKQAKITIIDRCMSYNLGDAKVSEICAAVSLLRMTTFCQRLNLRLMTIVQHSINAESNF